MANDGAMRRPIRKGMIDKFSLFSILLMFGLIYLLRSILLYPRLLFASEMPGSVLLRHVLVSR
jgi:hypothetical protein